MRNDIEAFVQASAPKGVEFSREGSSLDIIIQGTIRQALAMLFSAVLTTVMGAVLLKLAGKHCGVHGACTSADPQTQQALYIFGALVFLISMLCWFFSFRAWKTQTIIRVDALTGNFYMFKRTPWGEGKHFEFSSETAVPVIRKREYEDSKGGFVHYQLEVYPSLQASKAGIGFFKKNPDVFVVSNWNRDRCKWAKQLIQVIQKQKQ